MDASNRGRRDFLKVGAAAAALTGLTKSATGATGSTAGSTRATMPKRPFGNTGYQVALFSLGGQSALQNLNNEDVALPIIERALDLGVNYIDTSSIYGGPSRPSERYIGQVLKRRRSDTWIATKTKERTRDGSLRMLEESLRLLQTDHIDVWQLHDIGTIGDVNDVFAKGGAMEALMEAKEQKIVRHLGITGHHRPESLIECIHRYPFDTILMAYNAADKHQHSFTEQLLPLAVEKQMGIVGMKIPARGRLLTSWQPPSQEEQKKSWEGGGGVYMRPGTLSMREAMHYAWTQPVSTVIVGCDNIQQLEENVQLAHDFRPLSHDQVQELHAKTEPIAHQALWFRNFERS